MPFKRRSGSRLRSVALLPCGQYALGIVLRKVLRIGPRILLYLAVCFGLSIALMQLILNRAPRHDESAWWSIGGASSPIDAVMDRQLETARPEDLRVVVFGGQDAATPDGKVLVSSAGERAPSWTEVLCNELNSSTHLSFIPAGDGSQHPMISPEIYALAVERLLGERDPSHGPGENYSFQLDKFPIPSRLPGLAQQVTALLDTDAPGAAVPLETLWVFTFGTWEVWSLATFPLEISRPFLSLMTQTIFEQADRLYGTQSWPQETPAAGPTRRSQPPTDDVDTGDQRAPLFCILIPDLLDPSLLPAWKMSRPRLGRGHSKALQMRNAALLTKQWNQEVHEQMDRWVLDGRGGRADGPPRDGFLFDLPQYLVDAITEGQMRKMGEPRARPASEGFRDVSRPCASTGRDEGEVQACEAAGDRLFSTPFVAGAKAVRDIGTLAAEVVRNNKSQRASGRYVPPPRVAAWFERWDLRLASRQGGTKR